MNSFLLIYYAGEQEEKKEVKKNTKQNLLRL